MIRTTRTLAWLLGSALLLGAGAAQAQDWPQWRGGNRDNHVTGFAEPKTWPKELAKKWRVTVGERFTPGSQWICDLKEANKAGDVIEDVERFMIRYKRIIVRETLVVSDVIERSER